jgi:predicted amidophosphoribosyltransferase
MSLKVMSCKICGRLFQSYGSGCCPECADEMDKAFVKIKEYIYEHENATIVDVVEGTGIAEKYVLQFLKEGRLSIDNAEDVLSCEDCGRPISSGRYCSNCRDKLANVLSSVVEDKKSILKPSTQARMHAKYGRKY